MICVKDIVKKYGDHTVLNHISVTFEEGRTHGIVGRNGSGKTVFLKCLCGLIPVTSGSIQIRGKELGKDIEVPPDTGIIIEEPGFLLHYSGLTNLKMLASIRGKATLEEIEKSIRMVGLDPHDKNRVGHYSMGMRQRLGIAQSIMERPRLLILDEPMNGLDEDGVSEMRSLFNDLKRKGTTIVLATHNLDDMKILCDFVYEMKKGVLQPKGVGQSGGDGELS